MADLPTPLQIAAAFRAASSPERGGARDVRGSCQELANLRVGNILLIGASGSGKTTLMRAVEELLAANPALALRSTSCACTPTCSAKRPRSAYRVRSY